MTLSIKRVGTRGLIVDLPDLATVMNYYAALTASPLDHQTDVVAAARTVLLTFDSPTATTKAIDTLQTPNTPNRATSPSTCSTTAKTSPRWPNRSA